jgi:hypothetical protein
MSLANKALNEDYIRYETLNEEDRLLYNHIINANELDDIKK